MLSIALGRGLICLGWWAWDGDGGLVKGKLCGTAVEIALDVDVDGGRTGRHCRSTKDTSLPSLNWFSPLDLVCAFDFAGLVA